MNDIFDVAIVGAGPLGIEMAVAVKRAGLRYVHFDAGQIGATMQWWPAGTRWFSSPERISIAGVPLITPHQEKATREEYLAYLRSVVMQFELDIHVYELVTRIERTAAGFVVGTNKTGEARTYQARKVVCVTGGTARPRRLGIPGEDLPHVSHYFQDPHTYFRQRLLIIGGRNSAIEALLRCHRAGAKAALSYRREKLDPKDIKYWLYPEVEGLIRSRHIAAYFNTQPVAITPHIVRLAGPTGEVSDVEADFVLLMTGYEADMGLLREAGVALQPPCDVPAYDEQTMETNVPGLYVAGTAIAGTQQRYRVFLENCHVHVERIAAALMGKRAAAENVEYGRPES